MSHSDIRYEVQCRFCADRIGGDNASEAVAEILDHDATHPICPNCKDARLTYDGAILCDDCGADALRVQA